MSGIDLGELIQTRIENLRPKLLDLGRRNPLISTKLTPRSSTLVRVVDSLPEVTRYNLTNQVPVRFSALPPLEDDPLDEQTPPFQDAVSTARLRDEDYRQALDAVDPHAEDSGDTVLKIERDLKDRVRAALDMPPRQKKSELSLQEHALMNGIRPSWELPTPETTSDEEYTTPDLQTLLLPEDLERKLNGLMDKFRSWEQETGINVLHIAFGFLEWREPNGSESSFAPLALLPVKLEKKKTKEGAEYWLRSEGDETETNFVLGEKLRREFSVDLPRYSGGSIEDYFAEVAEAAPSTMFWRVRRQMVVGIFPSARMAMYVDLDTQKRSFSENEVVASLFGGSGSGGDTPFADEHNVDDPAIEAKAPYLVLDADSSQFSTIVDVADGKNLAVEGPPGTGKSQTIVNTIANALAQGKKILFVAEKMAALEVVKARLEAIGLGEFLLPLQAERSSREQVVESVRARIELYDTTGPRDYDSRLDKFREVRKEIGEYIEAISSQFGKTGLKVYDILGKGIATNELLQKAPRRLQSPSFPNVEAMNVVQIESALERARSLAAAWHETGEVGDYWAGLECIPADRFVAMELVRMAQDASALFSDFATNQQTLAELGFEADLSSDRLVEVGSLLEELASLSDHADPELVCSVLDQDKNSQLLEFLAECETARGYREGLEKAVREPDSSSTIDALAKLQDFCSSNGVTTLDVEALREEVSRLKAGLSGLLEAHGKLAEFARYWTPATSLPVDIISRAGVMVRATDAGALAVRSELTAGPVGAGLLDQLCRQGRDLQTEREALSRRLNTSTTLDANELRMHASVLSKAGPLAWVSAPFRSAKRAYLTLNPRTEFDKEEASQSLLALAKWKEDAKAFGDDIQARNIFGLQFRGIDTDFFAFELLGNFYKAVDAAFPGPAFREIRALLKTGDLDLIATIPEVSLDDRSLTFEHLDLEVSNKRKEIDRLGQITEQLAGLVGVLRSPSSISPAALSPLLESARQSSGTLRRLDEREDMSKLLGQRFKGYRTSRDALTAELSMISSVSSATVGRQGTIAAIRQRRLQEVRDTVRLAIASESKARAALSLLLAKAGRTLAEDIAELGPKELAQYLEEASQDEEGIYVHSRFGVACDEMDKLGLGWVVDELDENGIPLTELPGILEAVIYRAMAMRVYDLHGSRLAKYPGKKLDELRATLARLDTEIIKLTRRQLRANIARSAHPPAGNSLGRKSDLTEMALLHNEMSKKQKFLPVRDLTRRAGRALLELKPCWMMSPLAVAQYLPRDAVFDLCVIDEASQMPPEDAVGALSRSKQAMVVGDTNQLPPTSFFRKMIEDEDLDEDEAVLDESILEMANGVFRPARRLRWHYRSKHSALIQFSNQHIYDNDLIVFPSPAEGRDDLGVSLVPVRGNYKSGVNPDEAKAMIDAALRFMRQYPDRSLGLVTLNQKQRDLLLEEWAHRLEKDDSAAAYVDAWEDRNDGLERFFIKNLENVQGDERDVIFIGTVYGPEKVGGPVMQRFGPISGLAGRRRLNVLFSRAKQQIVTFSSMTSADIRADENSNPGAFMLKRWLEYSATGVLHAGENQGLEPDSEFEVFVIKQLRSMGFVPVPQVGVAGFRIDIGIKHPTWPHGYIMGVECDGAAYHSSRSARDRDRLREQVLNGLGWKLHRIWSTDWFNDPAKEAERLRQAVTARLDDLKQKASGEASRLQDLFNAVPSSSVDEDADLPAMPDREPVIGQLGVLPPQTRVASEVVEVGDTVEVIYLQGDRNAREVTLSKSRNAPDLGIVHISEPLGMALLGAEKDDEIELLVRGGIRLAKVGAIRKGNSSIASDTEREQQATAPTANGAGSNVSHATQGAQNLDPSRFHEASYRRVLQPFALGLIDSLGPVTFRHLSEIIARAHGFQRTGSQIKQQVWASVSKHRKTSRDSSGETTFWPAGHGPVELVPFRGSKLGEQSREWEHVPQSEKLGLAMDVISSGGRGDLAADMASRIGFSRLKQATRVELEALLKEAKEMRQ
ncbi:MULTISPECIES: DUF4011 domain-containing protein [Devosia]|uniref:DUF4011 domain-containing protein n=1 Tax=Devosia TaxID=46913 RepID=UPI001319CF1E|nr:MULTISPECIES: DUF3320 domain-containing protein [Devosia]